MIIVQPITLGHFYTIGYYLLQNISISNKCCSFELESWKTCITVSTKIWSSTTVFNTDDNNHKCSLSIRSSY